MLRGRPPHTRTDEDEERRAAPLPVQILTIIFYAGFAISVSIVAMAMFGLIGVALAVFMAWQWTRLPALGGQQSADTELLVNLRPDAPESGQRASGNASFDAYREGLLARLEQEQSNFEGFLDRLREAKDQSEFDRFLDDRAQARQDQIEQRAPAEA